MHDPTKLLLGSPDSSKRNGVQAIKASPTTFPAGTAIRLKSDGTVTKVKSEGRFLGVSLGKDLSNGDGWISYIPAGLRVPILLDYESADATVTITSYANLVSGTDDALEVGGVSFVAQAGAATPGDATFQAATSNDATAASLAAQINAHAVVGLLVTAAAVGAVVTITAKAGGTAGNAITLVYTDNDTNVGLTLANATGGHLNGGAAETDFAVPGAYVYISDTTGIATESGAGSTVTAAYFCENPDGSAVVKTGVKEDGTTAPAAYINMIGGL